MVCKCFVIEKVKSGDFINICEGHCTYQRTFQDFKQNGPKIACQVDRVSTLTQSRIYHAKIKAC